MQPNKIYYGDDLIYEGGSTPEIETIKGVFYPEPVAAGYTNVVLASGGIQSLASILSAPKDGNITHVAMGNQVLADPQEIEVRIETIDPSTGFPTGTLVNPNAVGTYTPQNVHEVYDVELNAPLTVTRGEILAVVVRCYAPVYSMAFRRLAVSVATSNPYSVTQAATSVYTKNTAVVDFTFKYSDGTYPYNTNIWCADRIVSTGNYNMNTVGFDQVGSDFIPPWTLRVEGLWFAQISATATASSQAILYKDDTIIKTVDKPVPVASTGNIPQVYYFDEDIILEKGESYSLGLKATGVGNMNVRHIEYHPRMVESYSGGGLLNNWTRKGTGAKSYNANQRTLCGFIVSGINS
jgi:hypothetical protein